MRRFVCTEKCYHLNRLWEKGREVDFEDFVWPIGKKGEIRHFAPMDGLPVPVKPMPEEAVKVAPDVVEESEKPKKPGRPVEMLECPKCGKILKGKLALAGHMRSHGIPQPEE